MKKTRKFISIFAILFAIVLALSVCFFAACGNKEEDETPTPEVQDDESKDEDTKKDDDTTVTPTPEPEPNPDPDPDPTPSNEYAITKDTVVAVPVAVTYNGASFENESGFTVTGTEDSDGTVLFAASGPAATMDGDQAAAFGANAEAGDAYVVIGIYSDLGDVISWTTSLGEEKSWEKTQDYVDSGDDLAIIERISAESTAFTFTITSTDGATATVSVSLEGVEVSDGTTTMTYTYSYSALQTALASRVEGFVAGSTKDATPGSDKIQLEATDFTGENGFLTLVTANSSNQYRSTDNGTTAFEIKTQVSDTGEITAHAVSVTFKGTGTLSITFCSTKDTNTSNFGIVNEDGNFIQATNYISNVSDKNVIESTFGETEGNYVYEFEGTGDGATVEYTISEPGTYYFFSYYEFESTNETTQATTKDSRGCRVKAITMVDTYMEEN